MSTRYKVLLIAEAANPEWVSVPLVGWSICNALSEIADVHIVTQIRNKEAFLRAGLNEKSEFTAIDTEPVAAPIWKLASILRGGSGKGWTTVTALSVMPYYFFEYLVWKKFKKSIKAGDYDIVHRITPLSPTIPSLIAKKCSRSNVPFIFGPMNGGVPWPREFDAARRKEKEWLSYLRGYYKILPGAEATLMHAAALIVGSSDTMKLLPAKYHNKAIRIPENAVLQVENTPGKRFFADGCLQICFVGRLVPYKGLDMLITALSQLEEKRKVRLDIIGDGPMMDELQLLVKDFGLRETVTFRGWLPHEELGKEMTKYDILGFPSIREFGGGVVLEAMASGIIPVVVDYAGPGDLVDEEVGFRVPLSNRQGIVDSLTEVIANIINEPDALAVKSKNCQERVAKLYTWTRKAEQILSIYDWAVKGDGVKPDYFESAPPITDAP